MAKYLVTATHPTDAKYGCTDHLFIVREDQRPDGTLYYASAERYGCGKSYNTPHIAITELLLDHACWARSIQRIED